VHVRRSQLGPASETKASGGGGQVATTGHAQLRIEQMSEASPKLAEGRECNHLIQVIFF